VYEDSKEISYVANILRNFLKQRSVMHLNTSVLSIKLKRYNETVYRYQYSPGFIRLLASLHGIDGKHKHEIISGPWNEIIPLKALLFFYGYK
jgi:hypothetical protein